MVASRKSTDYFSGNLDPEDSGLLADLGSSGRGTDYGRLGGLLRSCWGVRIGILKKSQHSECWLFCQYA